MKCLKCGFQNKQDLGFCTKCGTRLLKCKECNSPVLADDKFCSQCGHKLLEKSVVPDEIVVEPEIPSIQRYLKKKILKEVLSQRSRHEGEERYMAVLVCEMDESSGSVSGPDKLVESPSIKAQLLDILIQKINLYDGTVNEIVGDKIIAVFGGVIRLNDAPSRAVRSSWAIHRGIEKFEENFNRESNKRLQIKMRIGIHSGHQVLESVDEDLSAVLKGKEDLVKVSSIIAENAIPGSIYTSEDVFRHCYHEFRFEKPEMENNEGIVFFRVIGPRERGLYGDIPYKNAYLFGEKNDSLIQSKPAGYDITGNDSLTFTPEYPGSLPWKSSTSPDSTLLSPRIRVLLFLIIFYFILLLFVIGEMIYEGGYFFFFENFWINASILVSILLVVTCLLSMILNQIIIKLMAAKQKEKRLGSILLRNGYISESELDQVLAEQNQRLGEVLVKSGTIDASQLTHALELQKKSNDKLGEILVSEGITSEEEIRQALKKLDRKIGEILRDKGILSEYTLYWILHRQHKRI